MSPFSTNLSGRHVLVTGGSKGIGRAIVESFLAEGANVSFCARSIRGDEFSQFKGIASNARVVGSSVDIGKPSQLQDWIENAAREFGAIDCVVANASPLLRGPDPETWTKSFEADILGLVTLIQAAAPHLEKAAAAYGNASIVVISSLGGFEGRHYDIGGPYSTFKRAQAVLAKDHSRKLSPKGVRINTVVPGAVETPNVTLPDGTIELSPFQKMKQTTPEFFDKLLEAIPLGRCATPDDIANAVLFLSSPLASYISGTNLFVDGAMALSL